MSINSVNGNTLLESGSFPPSRVASTGSPLVPSVGGLLVVDGVQLVAGDRVLAKDETSAVDNGIYAAATGPWVRTSDAAGNSQFFSGMAVVVALGATNAGLTYLCTCADDPVVVGTSSLTFASQQAVAQGQQSATSTTSAALTTGAKTFATQSGKSFSAKQWVLIYQTSNPDNRLLAEITSYSGTSLVVSVAATGGSGGPYTDWSIVLTNSAAAAGRQPPIGAGNVTGPGSAADGNLPAFDGTTGLLLKDSGKAAGTLAGLNALTYATAGTASVGPAALAGGAGGPPYVAAQPTDNLTLTNDGTNPNTDIQISPGRAPDGSGLYWLALAGTMLKRIDTAFAAGGSSGNRKGMLLSGSSWLASKTYHLWLIGAIGLAVTSVTRSSNVATVTITGHPLGVGGTIRVYGVGSGFDTAGAVITAVATNTVSYANTGADVGATGATAVADGFDVGATQQDAQNYPAATLPTGFTHKQCLGSILTDGSKNIIAFFQYGAEFWLKSPVTSVSGLSASGSTLETLSVPLGTRVRASLNLFASTGATSGDAVVAYLSSPDFTDSIASSSAPGAQIASFAHTAEVASAAAQAQVWTSTVGQVRVNLAITTSGQINVVTAGWQDPRRRMF